jgi:hypothetical protein
MVRFDVVDAVEQPWVIVSSRHLLTQWYCEVGEQMVGAGMWQEIRKDG